jgi:WD40 repeat protein
LGVFKIQFTGTGSGATGNQVQAVAFSPDGNQLATSSQGTVTLWNVSTGKPLGGWGGTTENFVRIGHSLFTLLAGWFGGLLSRRLCRSPGATDASTPVHVEGADP